MTGAALRVPASHADAHAASFVLPLLGDQPGPGVSGGAGTDEESESEVYPGESEVYPAWELSLDGGGAGLWINTPEVSPLPTSGSVVRLPLVVVRLWSVVCLYVSVSLCLCVSPCASVCLRVSPCASVCVCAPLVPACCSSPSSYPVSPASVPFSPSHPLTPLLYFFIRVQIWWFQGDLGQHASADGGSVRVFGRSICPNGGTTPPTLRLTPQAAASTSTSTSAPITVNITATNDASCTAYAATFRLPDATTVPPGTYTADVLGGGSAAAAGWVDLEQFTSPEAPHDRRVVVQASGGGDMRAKFAARVFDVSNYCKYGVDCGVVGTNSSFAVLAALKDAKEAGGGTVLLPRGQWYLNHTTAPSAGALQVPPNVLLRGESTTLTAVFFPEQLMGEAPQPAYMYGHATGASETRSGGASGSGARSGSDGSGSGGDHTDAQTFGWGVEDITLYVSRYYEGIVNCGQDVDGFSMRRVRVRANAFAMLGAPAGSPSRGR